MAAPRTGFLPDVQTGINNLITICDAWETLKQEFSTFTNNGIVITDAMVSAIVPGMTWADLQTTLGAMQAIVDQVHTEPRKSQLYRMKR